MPMKKDETFNVSGVQHAHSLRIATCGDRECKHLHLVLFDEDEKMIAQATVDDDLINKIREVYNKEFGH